MVFLLRYHEDHLELKEKLNTEERKCQNYITMQSQREDVIRQLSM